MELELKIQQPILVKNPHTGRHVNIAPLFDAMAQMDGRKADSPGTLKEVVSRTIRAVNLAWDGDPVEQKNVNHDLYLFEDMFEAMSEFSQGK